MGTMLVFVASVLLYEGVSFRHAAPRTEISERLLIFRHNVVCFKSWSHSHFHLGAFRQMDQPPSGSYGRCMQRHVAILIQGHESYLAYDEQCDRPVSEVRGASLDSPRQIKYGMASCSGRGDVMSCMHFKGESNHGWMDGCMKRSDGGAGRALQK